MKIQKLHQWLWRWHVISGIIAMPFIVLLAITGGIYLFKGKVEQPTIDSYKNIEFSNTKNRISYQKQYKLASDHMNGKKPTSMVLPTSKQEATEFVWGKFSHKKSVFIHPYTGEVKGKFTPKDTWMYKVRKLHGELLTGKVGTKIIELVASWMVVLILTGIYIFFPTTKTAFKKLFTIRTKLGSRILFRDIHAIGGFLISLLLLLTLAGGFPWTDVFGDNFKKLQKATNTGFPKEWFGVGAFSKPTSKKLAIDEMVIKASKEPLLGKITLDFPKHPKAPFSISNSTFNFDQMHKIHFDQYSGKKLMTLGWDDIGILMQGRLWTMAFHQGQLGTWNFVLMFIVTLLLAIVSVSGLLSFQARSWGIPEAPINFKAGIGLVVLIAILSIVFPLFGISSIAIFLVEFFKKKVLKF